MPARDVRGEARRGVARRRRHARRSTSSAASTRTTTARIYNSALYATLGGAGPRRSCTCIARCSCRPTACSTRSAFSRAGGSSSVFPTRVRPRRDPDLRGCLARDHADDRGAQGRAPDHRFRAPRRAAAWPARGDARERRALARDCCTLIASEHGVYVLYAGLDRFRGRQGDVGQFVRRLAARRGARSARRARRVAILRARARSAPKSIWRARRLPLLGDLAAVLPDLWYDDELPLPRSRGDRCCRSLKRRRDRIDASLAIDAGADRALAGSVSARRADRAARHHAKPCSALSGGIDSARRRVSVRARARARERLRDPDAVPHVERRLARRRAARRRRARHQRARRSRSPTRSTAICVAAGDADPRRRGNVMARMRMLVLFDQSAQLERAADRHRQQDGTADGLLHVARRRHAAGQPDRRSVQDAGLGAGAPPRRSGASRSTKPPSADLEANQTDEGDLGVTYLHRRSHPGADSARLSRRADRRASVSIRDEVALVRRRVDGTHWKRHLPTTALVSGTAINEFYLRPVDY